MCWACCAQAALNKWRRTVESLPPLKLNAKLEALYEADG